MNEEVYFHFDSMQEKSHIFTAGNTYFSKKHAITHFVQGRRDIVMLSLLFRYNVKPSMIKWKQI